VLDDVVKSAALPIAVIFMIESNLEAGTIVGEGGTVRTSSAYSFDAIARHAPRAKRHHTEPAGL
jgi:hypothetical protein